MPPFFTESLPYAEYLGYAQAAFTIWMLIDAYRRGTEFYWIYIILFIPVLGAWAYFFLVKFPELGLGRGFSWPQWGPSLRELRYRAEHMPTLTNHLALAERLVQKDEHDEAVPHLEAALKREPDHGQALYLLARCHAASAEPARALPLLEKLIARDRYWSNYAAWYLLIEVRDALGDTAGAVAACRELARLSPTLRHQCLLAEHLLDQGERAEACELLDQALEEHSYSPGNIRWRNRRWASEAKRLLKEAQR